MAARIQPVDPAVIQGRAKELLSVVKSKLGMVPNTLKTMAAAPAVLDGYTALNASLAMGVLTKPIREQIALAVSQANGCEYCLCAHSVLGRIAGLTNEQIASARNGRSSDPKSQAILSLAQNILEHRGNVSDGQLAAARAAGLSDTEIVEIVGNVAAMTLTNFLNNVAKTEIDFPKVSLSA